MTENHFRNVNFMFRMLRNINPIAIIYHCNYPSLDVDININQRHWDNIFLACLLLLSQSHPMITTIYNTFIKAFVQSWDKSIFCMSHFIFLHCPVNNPILLDATNISIGCILDMLKLGFFLISACEFF